MGGRPGTALDGLDPVDEQRGPGLMHAQTRRGLTSVKWTIELDLLVSGLFG